MKELINVKAKYNNEMQHVVELYTDRKITFFYDKVGRAINLLISSGNQTNTKGLERLEKHAQHMKLQQEGLQYIMKKIANRRKGHMLYSKIG